jgi:hypothetical protein
MPWSPRLGQPGGTGVRRDLLHFEQFKWLRECEPDRIMLTGGDWMLPTNTRSLPSEPRYERKTRQS